MKENDFVRVNKYLAACGICSRREADRQIENGCVRINGKVAEQGARVFSGDTVTWNGKAVEPVEKKTVLAFYKPVGVTCSEKDPHAKKLITDLIRYPVRVTYAGRLDKDSEGLILLTNDGELIQAMMRGRNGHEKEYIVKTDREITEAFLDRMRNGVFLAELNQRTRPCQAEKIGKFSFRIILTQGLNRQIRRMCGTEGYHVTSLKRIRVLNIGLDGLLEGRYREITGEELKELYRNCGMEYGGTERKQYGKQ